MNTDEAQNDPRADNPKSKPYNMDSEKKFRIAFLGSDEIALPFLLNLERTVPQCEISAVLTQPDRPSGRGRKLTPNPIKQWAMDHSEVSDPRLW